ncbi:MAG: methyltransferase domain-containing protein [Bizionia sp.]|nr:methyltransferase domain-containing protein [Bizionia sp.]
MKKQYFRNLWYLLSSNQRFILRRLYYYPIDVYDKFKGNRHRFVPPRGSIYTGSPANSDSYIKQGAHQLELLKSEINLMPSDSVLDIGCGIGRTAIALSEYLNTNAKYEGFDVVKKGVDWCNSKINKEYPNFNFTYIPLFNDLYNNSNLKAENFKFPYKQESFDKIFSFSVFTHMQIDEIQNYFKQIHQVLKSDGIACSTFFLYDDANEAYISKREGFNFPIQENGFKLMNSKVKSGNIAIHKDKLNAMLINENLMLVKIIDGFWKDKIRDSEKKEYQDIVVFKKTE